MLLALLAMIAAPHAVSAAGDSAADKKPEPPPKIAIVTHPDNPITSVSRGELARIFMKTQTRWRDGGRCVPIDQLGDSPIRREFSRLILKKSVYEMKRYWMQETMTGNAKPPVSLESAATVKKYVEKIAGAVGYIYEDEVDDTVRVLDVPDVEGLVKPPPAPEKHDGDGAEQDTAPAPARAVKPSAGRPR